MSTRQKAAQLLVVGFPGTVVTAELAQLLQEGPVGGVLLYERNVESPEQLAVLTTTLQRAAAAGGSGLPLLVAVDQEGGAVRRVREGVPEVPGARTAATTLTPAEVRHLATEQAEALLRLGINTNLGPVADVVGDPASFLYQRSYGGDPDMVSAYVSAVVEGQEAAGLVSVVKHFPGHGAATGDSHLGPAVSALGSEEFWAVHLPPFEAAIRADAPAVLVSHIVAEGLGVTVPSSVLGRVIEELLRSGLGFQGVVVTDDMEMGGFSAAGGAGGAAPDAVLAGADLVIVGHTAAAQRAALEALVTAAENGSLPMERLDAAIARVLRLKSEYGLF
ncbi:MAG: glycoside hydrolase family 3 protein [Thermoleophilia bacterium]